MAAATDRTGVDAAAETFIVRAVGPELIHRAERLLGTSIEDESQAYAALASEPVERIVGVAVWLPGPGEQAPRGDLRFEWAVAPGRRDHKTPQDFLRRLLELAASQGWGSLRAVRLVRPDSWEAEAYRGAGFEVISRHEHFALTAAAMAARQEKLRQLQQPLPEGCAIEPLNERNCHAAAALVSRHRLMSSAAFWHGVRHGRWQEFSFVLRLGPEAAGVLLASAAGAEEIAIQVLAANTDLPLAGGAVCQTLFLRLSDRSCAAGISTAYFWAEPDRSPATKLLARFFDAQRLGETHQFGARLGAAGDPPSLALDSPFSS